MKEGYIRQSRVDNLGEVKQQGVIGYYPRVLLFGNSGNSGLRDCTVQVGVI